MFALCHHARNAFVLGVTTSVREPKNLEASSNLTHKFKRKCKYNQQTVVKIFIQGEEDNIISSTSTCSDSDCIDNNNDTSLTDVSSKSISDV